MTKIRPIVKKGEWGITKHAFYSAYHYALQYNTWKDEYNSLESGLSAVNMDGMPHGSTTSNPTEAKGIRMAELSKNISVIEETAKESNEFLYRWILKAVTNEDVTYDYLRLIMNMPCGKNMYYDARRKFYYLLSKRMNTR